MKMLMEFYDIWPTLRHVHNMSMTFPTKALNNHVIDILLINDIDHQAKIVVDLMKKDKTC